MKPNFSFAVLFALAALFSGCAYQSQTVDLIVHNARIYTADADFTVYEAMAIRDGKILELGPEREILNKYTAAQTIDCRKQAVYPGFIDAHCHFLAYGHTLGEADLTGTRSFSEVLQRLRAADAQRAGEWLIGRGWDQNDWVQSGSGEGAAFPSRDSLDLLFPTTPVYLSRVDGHAVLVNQAALDRAGITASTVVDGGYVEVKDGRCTGILVDNAADLVQKALPVRGKKEIERALLAAQEKCFAVGLTTVDDAGLMLQEVQVIDSLQRAGTLKMRIYAMMSDHPDNFEHYLAHGIDTTNPSLTVRSFKFYADGALGSRGACLLNPYEDLLHTGERSYGFLLKDPNYFRGRFAELHKAGFQVNTHAIGDSANRVMLGLYGEILGSTNDLRWRIEHAQVVEEGDRALFGAYSIIPSVQPTHATSDMPWAWERLGRNRVRRAYAYRSLQEQLGMVALGTDFPVEGISPFATFRAAVFRTDAAGLPEGGFQAEEALRREDALRGMTIWAAVANFEEHRKGSLEPGKWADFVVVDTDLLRADAGAVGQAKVLWTVVGGEIVYVRK